MLQLRIKIKIKIVIEAETEIEIDTALTAEIETGVILIEEKMIDHPGNVIIRLEVTIHQGML